MAAPGGRRKLVITARPSGARPADLEDLVEQRWGRLLSPFLQHLYARDTYGAGGASSAGASAAAAAAAAAPAPAFSLEELYSAVADICMHRLAQALFARVRAACAERADFLMGRVEGAQGAGGAGGEGGDAALLRELQSAWASHCGETSLLRSVFTPLDRAVLAQPPPPVPPPPLPAAAAVSSPLPPMVPLWDAGLDVLREALLRRSALLPRIVRALVAHVRRERRGETVDRAALLACVRMLSALGLYVPSAEPSLVRDAADYFRTEGQARMGLSFAALVAIRGAEAGAGVGTGIGALGSDAADVSQYLTFVEQSLAAERARVSAYLAASTLRHIVQALDAHLVGSHLTALIERGLGQLMEQGRLADLARLFSLAGRVARGLEVRAAFGGYCKAKASAIVGDKDNDEKDRLLVASLVAFRDEMERVIRSCFAEPFVSALKSAIEVAVNARENRPAELVARYLDVRLRSGAKGAGSEDELERELDKVMTLFKTIHGKDVFEAFYKKDLAKRLLLDRTSSMDLERSMVARLKTECGSQFTSKLEGMFRDVELAKDLNAQFSASKQGVPADLGLDVTVTVLTSAHWPAYSALPALLPPELARATRAFEAFYAAKYSSNRRLQWQHGIGRCQLRAAFPKGRKELEVSVVQAVVLMLFNGGSGGGLGFLRIKEDTGLEDSELRRTLQSLALGQHRVLRKERSGKEVEDGDIFHFNERFEAPLVRVKINQIQMKETRAEIDSTNERVLQDRQYQVDAAVVRILKSRKSLLRQALLGELFQQLRFPISAEAINKRIASLIERDYCEVDADDPQRLVYLA